MESEVLQQLRIESGGGKALLANFFRRDWSSLTGRERGGERDHVGWNRTVRKLGTYQGGGET
jgi:hypothetical protein